MGPFQSKLETTFFTASDTLARETSLSSTFAPGVVKSPVAVSTTAPRTRSERISIPRARSSCAAATTVRRVALVLRNGTLGRLLQGTWSGRGLLAGACMAGMKRAKDCMAASPSNSVEFLGYCADKVRLVLGGNALPRCRAGVALYVFRRHRSLEPWLRGHLGDPPVPTAHVLLLPPAGAPRRRRARTGVAAARVVGRGEEEGAGPLPLSKSARDAGPRGAAAVRDAPAGAAAPPTPVPIQLRRSYRLQGRAYSLSLRGSRASNYLGRPSRVHGPQALRRPRARPRPERPAVEVQRLQIESPRGGQCPGRAVPGASGQAGQGGLRQ
eukprot:scaffold2480_cov385-Prasinococcus_capsulatus_cf.AAC.6